MVALAETRVAPQLLLNRLHDFRVQIVFYRLLAGLTRWLALSLTFVMLVLLLDWTLELPALIRGIALVTGLAGSAMLWSVWVVRPMRVFRHPFQMAQLIEQSQPGSSNLITSAVQFIEQEPELLDLRSQVIADAYERVNRVSVNQLIDPLWSRTSVWLFPIAAAVLVGMLMTMPAFLFERGSLRLLQPFQGHGWTSLRIISPEQSPGRMARGEAFVFRLRIDGLTPPALTVRVQIDGGTRIDQAIDCTVGDDETTQEPIAYPNGVTVAWQSPIRAIGETECDIRIDADRIPRNFRFRVESDSLATEWQQMLVLPPPVFIPWEGRPSPAIRVTFPEYSEQPSILLTDGRGELEAIPGSMLTLTGAADRALASVTIRPRLDRPETLAGLATMLLPAADHPGFAIVRAGTLLPMVSEQKLMVGPTESQFHGQMQPILAGLYDFILTDTTGLRGSRLIDIRLKIDPTPLVQIDQPPVPREPLLMLPTGRLTLSGRVDDRRFGLRRIEWSATGMTIDPQRGTVFDFTERTAAFGAVAGAWAIPRGITPLAVRSPGSRMFEYALQLASIRRRDGQPLRSGDRLELTILSTDHDDVHPLKDPGQGHRIPIQIVSPDQFDESLQQQRAQQVAEVDKLRNDQRQTREALKQQREQLENPNGPKVDPVAGLAQVEQMQQQLRGKLQEPASGMLSRLEQLRQLAENNGMQQSEPAKQLQKLSKEANRLVEEDLPAIESALSGARRELEANPSKADANASASVRQALRRAESRQSEVEDRLNSLVEQLQPFNAAEKLRGELRDLSKEFRNIREQTGELTEKIAPGKKPEQLSAKEREPLERLSDRQQRLSEQVRGWNEALNRAREAKQAELDRKSAELARKQEAANEALQRAEGKSADDPRAMQERLQAELLQREVDEQRERLEAAQRERDLLDQTQRDGAGEALRSAIRQSAESVRKNQLEAANQAQETAQKKLDSLLESLDEQSSRGDSQLSKKLRSTAEELRDLQKEQDRLRKQIQQAESLPEPMREQAFRELAERQEQLQRLTRQLAREMNRREADQAAEQLRQADRAMEQAREQLEQGQNPEPALDQAQQQLEQSDADFAKQRQELEERLARDQILKRADRLKTMRLRQQATNAESERIQQSLLKAGKWDRALLQSLADLADRQDQLATDLGNLREKEFPELPVIDRALERAVEAMNVSRERLLDRRPEEVTQPVEAEVEGIAHRAVNQAQATALRRIDQLLQAFEDEAKQGRAKPKPMTPPMGEGAEPKPMTGDAPPSDSVPPMTQLRVLRLLQAEINERTAAFAKSHPNLEELDDLALAEWEELQSLQADVQELLREIVPQLLPTPMEK
ncbi:hypothetical protein [Tuwongella immobilis]|uniref:Uncharacterized protein n=1 Tax=Tuwongella immobilis TaxID=692036 RepID=A0A6C2YQL7_9BACT|nr:hypothetical protein [Tuwongella immobilis]VIP03295.1 Uncultured bacterium genome assembly Metasoil_fosmids_resub OS=uncultured bacterium PE=4 SV=1 [Tuwongella immobilis]VTS03961.1 Uncultured bacterium genome assembly Metasoil_fosmids_resub OS=uncultured bacterium PE=4 SV=1 [Tuwongella immobilis]